MPEKAQSNENEIKEGDFVSVKQKNTNNFTLGKIKKETPDTYEISSYNTDTIVNKADVEIYKMKYGQKFDKRELPDLYFIQDQNNSKIKITDLPNNEMKLLLQGKKTENIYTLNSPKTNEKYDVRLQLERENGRLKIAPTFKNNYQIKFESFNLNEDQIKEIKEGNPIRAELKNKESKTFETYMRIDKELNVMEYISVAKLEKQIDLLKDEKLKEGLQNLDQKNTLKFLNGKLKINANQKTVSYDFRNGILNQKKMKITQENKKSNGIKH